ncbi:helix-turn-helix transcriptional regulator [Clostridium sp.]|uniref:helix-turn-helix transcriptional regulator n=1 Tax=Clostridium sp. TaxID=1506 RepID=UPI0028415687|nr:helix-turn-helix transcriptional regulator [Clostridium sp.]MDR3594457.1 helix-turn-helix transcriptional regulator [Clostridium sp.]
MKSTLDIFGEELEYDFLSAWIKYTRMKNSFSQEALTHGICSVSHLSYFENGKKHLRKEVIEALLKKLNINDLGKFTAIGRVRQKFNTMMNDIESYNFDGAKVIYNDLLKIEHIINQSPYSIEFKIYDLMYKTFVELMDYEYLKTDIVLLDKIYNSLSDELKYLYLLVSGDILFRHHDNEQSIERLKKALNFKDRSWINFCLGKAFCFNDNMGKGTYYLEKALDSYEKGGRYLNALWCHNYLGVCFSYLKIYESAEKHFHAGLMSAKHFNMDKLLWHLYTNLSDCYLSKGNYEECLKWSKLAMESNYKNILCAYNYLSACIKLNKFDECNVIFDRYLGEQYKSSIHYNGIYYLYLVVYKLNDECFYDEVKNKILPYYENIRKIDICKDIKLKLIEYLESKRRYKEANKLYKELMNI